VDGLRVVGRTSSASFKDRKATATEIGRDLGVGAVLDGSVRRSGNRLRVTAQLVSTGDGYQLWAQEFDRELTDVFAVQDQIAREVVEALQVKLLPGRAPTTREYRTDVPEAYNQYLLGRHAYNAGDLDGLRRAAEEFERAVSLDPGFAPGWAGLASALTGLAYQQQGPEPVAKLQERALHAANQAVELDPELPEAYAARGAIRAMVFWDWSAAQADFERALALQPRDGPTQRRYGIFILASQGRIPEAIAAVRTATEVDPLYAHAWGGLGMLQVANGEGEAGERSLRRALELAPRNTYATSWMVVGNLLAGRPARALEAAGRIGDPIFRLHGKALAEHDLGNRAEARAALDALVAGHADGAAYQIAEVLAWWGEADQAFPWLERALRQRDAGLVHLKWDPLLRRLRGDPRFRELLARMRLPVDGP
jgi:tetratricopeptide (TPR) repeat protein